MPSTLQGHARTAEYLNSRPLPESCGLAVPVLGDPLVEPHPFSRRLVEARQPRSVRAVWSLVGDSACPVCPTVGCGAGACRRVGAGPPGSGLVSFRVVGAAGGAQV